MERLKNAERKVTGMKQVLRGLKNGELSLVYVAEDADTFLFQRVSGTAEECRIPVIRVASMKELGKACGVDVAAAAAGIVK